MKKMSKIISLSLVFTLLLTSINLSKTSAEANLDYTEEDVEELANVLEAIFEESIVYNDDDFVGFKQDVLNNEVLNTEYAEIIDELEEQDLIINNNDKLLIDNNYDIGISAIGKKENPKWTKARDNCFYEKMKDSYGPAALNTIWLYIKNKDWTNAAKKLLKLGVKGNVAGIVTNMMWSIASCGDVASKKHKRYL